MSHLRVGIALDRLLSDETFRLRFAVDRLDALAELYTQGLDLTPEEVDLFCQIDVRVLSWSSAVAAGFVH